MLFHNLFQSVRFWENPFQKGRTSSSPFLGQRFCYFAETPEDEDSSTGPEMVPGVTPQDIADACQGELDPNDCARIAAKDDAQQALDEAMVVFSAMGKDSRAILTNKNILIPQTEPPDDAAPPGPEGADGTDAANPETPETASPTDAAEPDEIPDTTVIDNTRDFRGQYSEVLQAAEETNILGQTKGKNLVAFGNEKRKLETLAQQGSSNWTSLESNMKSLVDSKILEENEANYLLSLPPPDDPSTTAREYRRFLEDEFKRFNKARARKKRIPGNVNSEIIQRKVDQFEIDNQIATQMDKVNEILGKETSRFNDERYKEVQYRMLERTMGFAPRPAVGDESAGAEKTPVTNIRYQDEETSEWKELSVHSVEVIHTTTTKEVKGFDEKKKKRTKKIEQKSPTGLKITLSNNETYSIGRFRKWAEQTQAQEIIDKQPVLEEKLGLKNLGIALKPGMWIEYTVRQARDAENLSQQNRLAVKIKSFTHKGVLFENPVTLPYPPNETKAALTFSEFAKFFRFTKGMVKVDHLDSNGHPINNLRNYLNKHRDDLDVRYQRPHLLYEPIEVKVGEKLQFGDNYKERFKITKVNERAGRLSFRQSDGTVEMTFGEFLRWVIDNDVEKFDPEREATLTAQMGQMAGLSAKKIVDEAEQKKADLERQSEKDEESAFDAEKWQKESMEERERLGLKIPDQTPPEAKENLGGDSYLSTLWQETTLLSIRDIIQVAKTFKESLARRHGTKSRRRGAEVGKHLPGRFGMEFERDAQAAENDEVNQYKEAMAQWGIWQIRDTLHKAADRFQIKACIITLVEKGQMRWDDPKFWDSLNRHIPSHLYVTPERAKRKELTTEDLLEPALDSLYGESQFTDWHKQNGDVFNSEKKKFTFKGDQLEGGAKGMGLIQELQKLLRKHMEGEYVNPQEFEGLIDFAIIKGKARVDDKLYYLIEGVCRRNFRGETILNLDRIGALDGEYLNHIPWLDFLVDKDYAKYKGGEPNPWTVEDFEKIAEYFDSAPESSDPAKRWLPNKNVVQFFWQVANTHHKTHVRNSKGIRKGVDIDHDDWHFVGANLSSEDANYLLDKQGGAARITVQGLMNAYSGFQQQLKSYGKIDPKWVSQFGYQIPVGDRVKKLIAGYVTFDSILMKRHHKSNDHYYRLDPAQLKGPIVCDPTQDVNLHRTEMDKFLKLLCDEYKSELAGILQEKANKNPKNTKFFRKKAEGGFGDQDYDYYSILTAETDSVTDQDYVDRQKFVENIITGFGNDLERVVGTDEKRLVRVIQNADLKGMATYQFRDEPGDNYDAWGHAEQASTFYGD